jgi:hypothetical protein
MCEKSNAWKKLALAREGEALGKTLDLPARSPASRSLAEGRRFGEGRAAPLILKPNKHQYK